MYWQGMCHYIAIVLVGSLSARLLEPREGEAVREFALFISVAALFMRSRHVAVVMGRFASGSRMSAITDIRC